MHRFGAAGAGFEESFQRGAKLGEAAVGGVGTGAGGAVETIECGSQFEHLSARFQKVAIQHLELAARGGHEWQTPVRQRFRIDRTVES